MLTEQDADELTALLSLKVDVRDHCSTTWFIYILDLEIFENKVL